MGSIAYCELQDCRYEKVLLAAMKYALTLEEGDVVEAVIGTLKPRVPYLADDTLAKMATAVEMYVYRGRQFDFGESYLKEWTEVCGWLLDERVKRMRRAREEDEDVEGS
jgi:hypothetical protein